MKRSVFFITFLVTTYTFSQNLECCKTIDAVIDKHEGNWKEEYSNYEITYQFDFSQELGIVNEIVKKDNELIILECPTNIELIKNGSGFRIKYMYLLSYEVYDIIFLNDDKFLIKNANAKIEYVRAVD